MDGLYEGSIDWVTLRDFLDNIFPSINNVPDTVAAHAVRLSAIEFCRRSNVLRDRIQLVTQSGVNDYVLDPPTPNLQVMAVAGMSANGIPMKNLVKLPAMREYVRGFVFVPSRELFVFPAKQQEIVEIDVVMLPTQETTELPKPLYEEYSEAVTDGALNRLFSMKTASWYDLKLAGVHMNRFRHAVTMARTKVMKGDTTDILMATAPRWC